MLIVKGSKIWGNGKKWRRFDSFRGHGYITKDKIGVLKINGDEQKLIVKKSFTLNKDFVKLITKT